MFQKSPPPNRPLVTRLSGRCVFGIFGAFSKIGPISHETTRRIELGSPRPSTEPKTPKPQKVSKKVCREVSGTSRDPQKSSKKVRKVQKVVDFNYFLDFSDFFGNLLGVPGGPGDLSGDFLETFCGFGVLGSVDGRGDPKNRGFGEIGSVVKKAFSGMEG